jgi:hypothetical protein
MRLALRDAGDRNIYYAPIPDLKRLVSGRICRKPPYLGLKYG